MKRNLYTFVLLLCTVAFLNAQVPRKILVEETTQASCPPCAVQNPAFDALMEANDDKVVVVKYQVWWPGSDPMYDQTKTDVDTRVNALGPNAAPNIYVNSGGFESLTALTQARIDQMSVVTSPISIEINYDNDGVNEMANVEITVTNESSSTIAANSLTLFTVLKEHVIEFPVPPGTNGETEFRWVMRKMFPSGNGMLIGEELAPGASTVISFGEPIPAYIYNLDQLEISAFVEQAGVAIQAETTGPIAITGQFPNVEMGYDVAGYDGYCSSMVDLDILVQNTGDFDINSFDIVQVLLDGSTAVVYSSSDVLAVGEEATISFADVALNFGANSYFLVISNVQADSTTRRLKNILNSEINGTVYYAVSDTPFDVEIAEGFDITQLGEPVSNAFFDNPFGLRVFTVNRSITTPPLSVPLGGHGNSDGCLRFDFPTWPGSSEAALVFDKIDLTSSINTRLLFTYAYAPRGGFMGDRISIEISDDCAQSWKVVYSEFGDGIVTGVDPGVQSRFYPQISEWSDVSIDLSEFDGKSDIIVRFIGTSMDQFGAQCYYLDDIILESGPVGNTDIAEISKLNVYPNPASDRVNLDFDLNDAKDLQVKILDANGKLVEVLCNASYPVGRHSLQWYPQAHGVYVVQFESGKGIKTERITVTK